MKKETSPTAIIVVTRNSEPFIDKCINSINSQTLQPLQIILSDTGSDNTTYLNIYENQHNITRIDAGKNVGFCKGNNAAVNELDSQAKYILLLNPDAFLFPEFLEKATSFMEKTPSCGICTGTLFGYDIDRDQPSGYYDSTGIQHTWYGKWYDRDQRKPVIENKYTQSEEVPAACGALMFCRRDALHDSYIFDPSFYMYKEDIDLSIRVRKSGYEVIYAPNLKAYHCRGWSTDRRKVPKKYRLASAKNELRIHWKNMSPVGFAYSSIKYLAVKAFNL